MILLENLIFAVADPEMLKALPAPGNASQRSETTRWTDSMALATVRCTAVKQTHDDYTFMSVATEKTTFFFLVTKRHISPEKSIFVHFLHSLGHITDTR